MSPRLEVIVAGRPEGGRLVAPTFMTTPHCDVAGVEVQGGTRTHHDATETGQQAMAIDLAPGAEARIVYTYGPGTAYPEAMFALRDSRFTRAAEALAEDARAVATGPDPVQAVAQHVASLFTYGHPDTRFYDGEDHIPQLCSIAAGSCVDINAYFIASLRSAGLTAGYVTGCFFPAEKTAPDGSAWCDDMHCWVVTRCAHGEREWDIAHHMKAGLPAIGAALDPKPGWRVPLAHSMGLTFPGLGLTDIKLMSEPMWLGDGCLEEAACTIRGQRDPIGATT